MRPKRIKNDEKIIFFIGIPPSKTSFFSFPSTGSNSYLSILRLNIDHLQAQTRPNRTGEILDNIFDSSFQGTDRDPNSSSIPYIHSSAFELPIKRNIEPIIV